MRDGISLEGFDSHLVSTLEETSVQPQSEDTLRIALLGDWSGRASRGLQATGQELANWQPRLVDRDNLEEMIAKLGAGLQLIVSTTNNTPISLTFQSLDDFHPDQIFERTEHFQILRDLRTKLRNAGTFQEAADEVRSLLGIDNPSETSTEESKPVRSVSSSSLLDQVLEQGDVRAPLDKGSINAGMSPEIRALVQEAIQPYIVFENAEQDSLVASVDRAITEQMRLVLHHPDFQALESAWRALYLLATRLETGSELKLYLLDISRAELDAALSGNLKDTGIYKLLVENSVKTFGGERWGLISGNYTFSRSLGDATILAALANIAKGAGAAFVGGASSELVGSSSFATQKDPDDWRDAANDEAEQAWSELRSNSSSKHLALALPRFLVRLPYGSETEPTEQFEFEELTEPSQEHDSYLWANPSFAVSYLIAKSFLHSGWNLQLGDEQEIDGLPLHVYEQEGQSEIKPCAEVLMTVAGAQKIIDRGLIPLITMKNTDAVRVGMFQSIASPPSRLFGPWE
jgi:type VI secretion system protein ImpC